MASEKWRPGFSRLSIFPRPSPGTHQTPAPQKRKRGPSSADPQATALLSQRQPREGGGEGTEAVTSGWDPDRNPHSRLRRRAEEAGKAGP
ncbi:unnamed protein product [Rangifer tarandus platyrhynchus]|uniref:Uncharacterized protein n=2 Tax=Rangifer tarandus platyrhynchus TaxID=3082113 RepID=A0ABN8YY71_RANTA|nr:unnamed protein product [Rangifer tarandus platyrhynchus]CAI9694284.1 unnamed protein product [Rangifer tarandus platyrhynchus]